jgi:hypothetical protein
MFWVPNGTSAHIVSLGPFAEAMENNCASFVGGSDLSSAQVERLASASCNTNFSPQTIHALACSADAEADTE